MSRVKEPREKKRLSLERDRRNVFGENDKASRKAIPRRKQLSHMRIRRNASQVLAKIKGDVEESRVLEAEALVKTKSITLRRTGFEKTPDRPLGIVIEEQRKARLEHQIMAALRKAGISFRYAPLGCEVDVDAGDFGLLVGPGDAFRANKVVQKVLRTYSRK
ncbi:MAG: hypothetical protein WAN23_19540 [Candidatus Acidiferrales bacterium]